MSTQFGTVVSKLNNLRVQVGESPLKVSTQPLRELAVAQDAPMRDQMQGMRLALTNALKELLQVSSCLPNVL